MMFAFLQGRIADSLPNRATINVNGVGYELLIPLSTFDKLPLPGQEAQILTHLHVREQELTLYGFATGEERDLFRLLIDRVSGIGPKLALAVLSGMSVTAFKSAVVANDTTALAKISGLGKKTADRIVLELKDKVGVAAAWQAASENIAAENSQESALNDAVLALIQLGYKQVEAHKAVKKAAESGELDANAESGEYLRAALRHLS